MGLPRLVLSHKPNVLFTYTCEGGCGITGSYAAMLEHAASCNRAAAKLASRAKKGPAQQQQRAMQQLMQQQQQQQQQLLLPIVIPNKRVRLAPGICHSRAPFAPALICCSRICLIGAPCHIPIATDARSREGPRARR
jgi:hypothetical protein